MARPRRPLIDRERVLKAALNIIDRDGLDAVSIRRIGSDLGIDGTSLYHHFVDKEAILHGVRLLVLQEDNVGEPAAASESWQDYVRRTTIGYRKSLLRHPNAAPLLAPTLLLRPFSLVFRDRVASKLEDEGVPTVLVFPIIDSVETLAYASALLNPGQKSVKARIAIMRDDHVPALENAVSASPRSPDTIFELQLEALIAGWTAMMEHKVVALA
jgi:TetR/AcrR family transcriptional regulator, tetracycline repressor protein